jgi:hypothetical protein
MIKQYSVFQRKKVNKLPLTPSLQKAREEHERYLESIGYKKTPRSEFTAFNDINTIFNSTRKIQKISNPKPLTHMGNGAPKRKSVKHSFTVAPAYNKGAYQVIHENDTKDIGK